MPTYAIALSLFFVLNSIGNIPIFVGLLSHFTPRKQKKIIIRELIIALGILLLFNFFGDNILQLLGISQPIIGIAGGILLFLIALGMIFPKQERTDLHRQEPLIVPLATPIVAGPGAIATVMVYSEQFTTPWVVTCAILIAWLPSLLILLAAPRIKNLLGEKGLTACERLGGMLICLIAVQLFSSGVIKLVQEACYSH